MAPSTADEKQIQSLLACPAAFQHNFTSEHEILLPFALDKVWEILGRGDMLKEQATLSDLCRHFSLLHSDTVSLQPGDALLQDAACRDMPSSSSSASGDSQRILPRQFFHLQEAVPILPFGLYDHLVNIAGSLTSDEERHTALYESSASGNVVIWKLRTLEKVTAQEGGSVATTKVKEVIQGKCSGLLRRTVEKETRRAHK